MKIPKGTYKIKSGNMPEIILIHKSNIDMIPNIITDKTDKVKNFKLLELEEQYKKLLKILLNTNSPYLFNFMRMTNGIIIKDFKLTNPNKTKWRRFFINKYKELIETKNPAD